MAYRIDTVKDKAGRWHYVLDGGKISSSDTFGSEAEAEEAAKEAVKFYEATEVPPVAGPVEVKVRKTAPKKETKPKKGSKTS